MWDDDEVYPPKKPHATDVYWRRTDDVGGSGGDASAGVALGLPDAMYSYRDFGTRDGGGGGPAGSAASGPVRHASPPRALYGGGAAAAVAAANSPASSTPRDAPGLRATSGLRSRMTPLTLAGGAPVPGHGVPPYEALIQGSARDPGAASQPLTPASRFSASPLSSPFALAAQYRRDPLAVAIRPPRLPEELPAFESLHGALLEVQYEPEFYESLVTEAGAPGGAVALAAYAYGGMVGVATARAVAAPGWAAAAAYTLHGTREGYVMTLGVLPQYRRAGVARRLVTALCAELAGPRCRCTAVSLHCLESNGAARALYASVGFRDDGPPLPGHYRFGGREHAAVRMTRDLSALAATAAAAGGGAAHHGSRSGGGAGGGGGGSRRATRRDWASGAGGSGGSSRAVRIWSPVAAGTGGTGGGGGGGFGFGVGGGAGGGGGGGATPPADAAATARGGTSSPSPPSPPSSARSGGSSTAAPGATTAVAYSGGGAVARRRPRTSPPRPSALRWLAGRVAWWTVWAARVLVRLGGGYAPPMPPAADGGDDDDEAAAGRGGGGLGATTATAVGSADDGGVGGGGGGAGSDEESGAGARWGVPGSAGSAAGTPRFGGGGADAGGGGGAAALLRAGSRSAGRRAARGGGPAVELTL